MGITKKASRIVKENYYLGDEFTLNDFLGLLKSHKLSSAMGTAKRTTQELRDLGILHFLGNGRYELIEGNIKKTTVKTILKKLVNTDVVDEFKNKVKELNVIMLELYEKGIEVSFHHLGSKVDVDIKRIEYL